MTPTVILAFVPEESKAEMTCHNCRIEMVKAGFYGKDNVQFNGSSANNVGNGSLNRPRSHLGLMCGFRWRRFG